MGGGAGVVGEELSAAADVERSPAVRGGGGVGGLGRRNTAGAAVVSAKGLLVDAATRGGQVEFVGAAVADEGFVGDE